MIKSCKRQRSVARRKDLCAHHKDDVRIASTSFGRWTRNPLDESYLFDTVSHGRMKRILNLEFYDSYLHQKKF